MDDNKKYNIELPMNDVEMLKKFETTIKEMRSFSMDSFKQNNLEKCKHCIYEPACDRCLTEEKCWILMIFIKNRFFCLYHQKVISYHTKMIIW